MGVLHSGDSKLAKLIAATGNNLDAEPWYLIIQAIVRNVLQSAPITASAACFVNGNNREDSITKDENKGMPSPRLPLCLFSAKRLHVNELFVKARFIGQFLVRTFLHYPTLIEHDDLVGILDGA